ncbi:hypothetical protein GT755_10915 [Herbidospora sp. NEAU-GS84]|uniref:Uncharacterized protein n=1 Tax=Herbidospora solisilvae TaxID=2696284 RepID=A0A7C9N6I5_9ACTN|nr:hypothetical protein [Herbidospora solisilvae]NAS22193.1 hypothetical protein [Herbidospora solisilvae]
MVAAAGSAALTTTPPAIVAAQQAHRGPGWDIGDDHCSAVQIKSETEYPGSYYGMLRARAQAVGDWEKFTICPEDGCNRLSAEKNYKGVDAIRDRVQGRGILHHEALANNKYVSTEPAYTGDGYGILRARADVVGDYEKFVIS